MSCIPILPSPLLTLLTGPPAPPHLARAALPAQLIGRAAALELGIDISHYPTYSSDHDQDMP